MESASITDREVKDRILSLAREKFVRDGFTGVSVDALTREFSISKKTFYKFFGSKDDLLGQIVERITQEIDLGVQAILSSEESFVHKMDAVMLFIGRQLGKIVRPFMYDLQRDAPELWKRVQEFRRARMLANIQSLFLEGIKGGYIRPEVNTRVLFLAFVGSVETIMIPTVLANESFSGDEAMHSILRIFLHGILTEDASRQLRAIQQHPTSPMHQGVP